MDKLLIMRLLGTLCIISWLLSGCNTAQGDSMSRQAQEGGIDVSSDSMELEERINLPIQPQNVQWQITTLSHNNTPLPGGVGSLIAILDYTPEQLEQLKTMSGVITPKEGILIPSQALQDWIPEDIHAAVIPTSSERLVEIKQPAYNAENFEKAGTGWKPEYWLQVGESSQIMLVAITSN